MFLLPYNIHITISITPAKWTYIVFLSFSLKHSTKQAVSCFFRKAPTLQLGQHSNKKIHNIFFDQVC